MKNFVFYVQERVDLISWILEDIEVFIQNNELIRFEILELFFFSRDDRVASEDIEGKDIGQEIVVVVQVRVVDCYVVFI